MVRHEIDTLRRLFIDRNKYFVNANVLARSGLDPVKLQAEAALYCAFDDYFSLTDEARDEILLDTARRQIDPAQLDLFPETLEPAQ
jgi:hypothetical protein